MTTSSGSPISVKQQIDMPQHPSSTSVRIPSLDGLRAVSILLVLVGHASGTFPHRGEISNHFLAIFGNGGLGVLIFFVISGFLITTLLLKELQQAGNIDIKQFYLRRAFRILPAFYLFIAAVSLLALAGCIQTKSRDIALGALFLQNYNHFFPGVTSPQNWFVGHLWSLSVEEQFYLLWPLSLIFLKKKGATIMAILIICTLPFVRVCEYFALPGTREIIPIMLHTRADSLMFGCLIALLYQSRGFQELLQRLFGLKLHIISMIFVFVISPLLAERFKGIYLLPLGWTLEGAGTAVILLWVIQNPNRSIAKLLNYKPIVYLGVISYSLYLWQQPFLTTSNTTIFGKFPYNLLFCLTAAQCSFWLIEQPFLRLRKKLSSEKRSEPIRAVGYDSRL